MQYIFNDLGMGVALAPQTHRFPEGTYLSIGVDLNSAIDLNARAKAGLRVAEIASIVELQHPDIIFEKVFEDVVNTRTATGHFPEGMVKVVSRPLQTAEDLKPLIALGLNALDVLPSSVRERFALCSRWFRRGADATSPIDKFLFYYIVLEIFPASGSTDVPGRVRDFLHTQVYPTLTRTQIKERSQIGRIAGLRADIVHDGLGMWHNPKGPDLVDLTERLEGLCRVALRTMIGLSPGDAMDRWMFPKDGNDAV
jgi:hypothetical protein